MLMASNKEKNIHKPNLAHRFETANSVSMNKMKKKTNKSLQSY